MGEGRLTEQGSGKVADYTDSIVIMTSNAHAEKILSIRSSVEDEYDELNAVKGYLADTKTFRPELIGRIDKVSIFNNLNGIVIAEIALLKIAQLAGDYGIEVKFVDPDSLIKILMENDKVSRFGIRELERIIADEYAEMIIEARENGAKVVEITEGKMKNLTINKAA